MPKHCKITYDWLQSIWDLPGLSWSGYKTRKVNLDELQSSDFFFNKEYLWDDTEINALAYK